jgi:phospholipid/cholesterol/gamma-HCH transport system ATP-binding protein
MNQPLIKVENLTSGYGDKKIIRDINLEIFPNEITVILGTSGCGKTTLLKHLIGLLRSDEGQIELFGRNISNLYDNEFNTMMRRIGVLFQNGALLNSISVAENIAIPVEQHSDLPAEIIEQLVRLKLDLVGLKGVHDFYPSQLSGGMKKRVALARAIALDPEILFADEPGAGLDPVTASALDRLLLDLRRQLGMTLVVVTHELASIKRIADKICFLEDGKVLFYGTLSDAKQSNIPQIESFFQSGELNHVSEKQL